MAGARNRSLDLLKLVASFFVVAIHVPLFGVLGELVKFFGAFAVPVFFLTSGFFSYGNDAGTLKRKLCKIAAILLGASLLYNALGVFFALVSGGGDGVLRYFSAFLSPSGWVDLLLFNVPFSSTRLWFLFALIYVYGIELLLCRLPRREEYALPIALVLLFLRFLLGTLLPLAGTATPEHFYRNFLLTGYPFFSLGLYLRRKEAAVRSLSDPTLLLLCASGVILTLVAFHFAPQINLSLGVLLLTLTLFCLCIKHPYEKMGRGLRTLSSASLGIYVFHRPATDLCANLLSLAGLSENTPLFANLLTLSVCVTATAIALFLRRPPSFFSSEQKEAKKSQS